MHEQPEIEYVNSPYRLLYLCHSARAIVATVSFLT
jgi:hypothetical protein